MASSILAKVKEDIMTWGEIQIIALEKMFAKDEPIKVKDLENLRNDDDCKLYLSSMLYVMRLLKG